MSTSHDPRGERRATLPYWLAALAVAAAVLPAVSYSTGDPDSRLYSGIAIELAERPFSTWIAPEWWGFWNSTGLFVEHPVGIFLLPALLARLGYPAGQAAFAANAVYQVTSFALVAAIARTAVGARDARALSWLVQLIPIAFVFRVRANHEYAVLAGWLFAIYGTERSRDRPAWTLGMAGGFAWVLLVKGVFAFMVPVACAVWLLARRPGQRAHAAWAAIVAMPVASLVLGLAYEAAYASVTGQSFVRGYLGRQVPGEAVAAGVAVGRVAYNLVWYAGRVIWYAFPWSLAVGVLLYAAWRSGRRAWPPADDPRRQATWFVLVTSVALVVVFALAHRKADRYLFPVYFSFSALGAAVAIERSARLQWLVRRLDHPCVPASVWLLLLLLRVVTLGQLPEFTFWRS